MLEKLTNLPAFFYGRVTVTGPVLPPVVVTAPPIWVLGIPDRSAPANTLPVTDVPPAKVTEPPVSSSISGFIRWR
jgi:hypothetical protein